MDEPREELQIAKEVLSEQTLPENGRRDPENTQEAAASDAAQSEQKEVLQQQQPTGTAPSASANDNITIPIRARKEKKRRIWLWILIPALVLLLAVGAYMGYFYFLRVPPAEQVILKDSQTVLREGDSYPIRFELYPSGADKTLKWSSSNPKAATVDDTGRVSAISAGVTTITAKAKSGATGSCYVTVRPQITDEERELLGTWSLFVVSDQGHINYYYGSAFGLTFYSDMTGILLENGEETDITWSFDEIIDGYNYYNVKIPGHRGATLKLNSNTGDGMSGALTLELSDTLLWVFSKK